MFSTILDARLIGLVIVLDTLAVIASTASVLEQLRDVKLRAMLFQGDIREVHVARS
jgi:hypothetical protein